MNDITYQQLAEVARQIVSEGIIRLGKLQSSFTIAVRKDEVDIATSADIAVERDIVLKIRKRYPTHSILSEELGKVAGDYDYTWIIDPLDGTKEFARGSEEYGCLIGIERKKCIVAGAFAIYDEHHIYMCIKGSGAYYNGAKTHVSKTEKIEHATLSFHIPIKQNTRQEKDRGFRLLRSFAETAYRVRVNNFEAKVLGWVGRGILDAHIFPASLNEWYDVAACLLYVEEAGGTATDWFGDPIRNRDISRGVIASNGILHEQLLQIISDSRKELEVL